MDRDRDRVVLEVQGSGGVEEVIRIVEGLSAFTMESWRHPIPLNNGNFAVFGRKKGGESIKHPSVIGEYPA